MAPPPRIRSISRESIPGAPSWMDPLLAVLNDALGSIANALSKSLTRGENMRAAERLDSAFTSTAASEASVTFRNELPVQPKHVVCSKLTLENGAPPSDAWSISWRLNGSGQVLVTFQGLAASTSYLASFAYE